MRSAVVTPVTAWKRPKTANVYTAITMMETNKIWLRQIVIDEDGIIIEKEDYKNNYFKTIKIEKNETIELKPDGTKRKVVATVRIVQRLGNQGNLF